MSSIEFWLGILPDLIWKPWVIFIIDFWHVVNDDQLLHGKANKHRTVVHMLLEQMILWSLYKWMTVLGCIPSFIDFSRSFEFEIVNV